jgi:polysaccharide export outer membrane protein
MAKTLPRIAQTPSIAAPASPNQPSANAGATTTAAPANSARLNVGMQSAEPKQDRTIPAQSPKIISTGSTQTAALTSQDDYIIGPEDELEIVVWKQPELRGRVVVRPDGKIGIPLLNDVQAAGLSPVQLSGIITRDLKPFLQEPQVAVIVTAAKNPQLTIQGAIARPGRYYLSRPMTVMELIAEAGGLTEFAKREQIAVIRQNGGASVRYRFDYTAFLTGSNLEQNVILKGGDIIVVP